MNACHQTLSVSGLRGGDCRARQRLRLLELASLGEQERLGGSGHHPNAGTGRRDSPSLFEESLGLVEAAEVAEVACETAPWTSPPRRRAGR